MSNNPNHPRNLFRFIVGLFLAAAVATLLAMATGCRSSIPDITTGKVKYHRVSPDGSQLTIDLVQPKDLEIGAINIDPQHGVFVLTNYSSVANQGALRARVDEAAQQREMVRDMRDSFKDLVGIGAMVASGGVVRPGLSSAASAGAVPPQSLPPDAIAQIVATLRSMGFLTNAPATNRPPVVP